ncbi:MAG: TRAP transporter substrate-binding protein [candidate division WOR-3 bacterium]
MLKEKSLIVVASLALLIGWSAVAFGQTSGKKADVRWKFSTFVPSTHFTIPPTEKLIVELNEASGGRVGVDLYHSAVLGTTTEHYDLIREGTAQMGGVCAGYNPDRFQMSLFSALPFSADDAQTAGKINQEFIKKNLINEEWKEVKLCFAWSITPSQIQSNKKLSTVEDFKGLRITPGSGLFAMIWEAIGAKGVNIPLPEAPMALERGTIDATALNWSGASGFKFHEVTKYPYDIGITGGSICFIFANRDAWNKLPPDVQTAWEKIFEQKPMPWSEMYDEYDEKGRQAWRNLGKEVTQFPAAEKAKLAEKLLPVWQAWIQKQEGRGKPAKELYKTYVEVMKREGKPVLAKVPGLYQE